MVVPSEYVPEAVNCLELPTGMLGLSAVVEMETREVEEVPVVPGDELSPPPPPQPETASKRKIERKIETPIRFNRAMASLNPSFFLASCVPRTEISILLDY